MRHPCSVTGKSRLRYLLLPGRFAVPLYLLLATTVLVYCSLQHHFMFIHRLSVFSVFPSALAIWFLFESASTLLAL
jgi:hypothetical protein